MLKGLAFPFRMGQRGGLLLTTTTVTDPVHTEENLVALLATSRFDRVMEHQIYSDLVEMTFENDTGFQSLMRFKIVDCINRNYKGLEVREDWITFEERDGVAYATVPYKITGVGISGVADVRLGGEQ